MDSSAFKSVFKGRCLVVEGMEKNVYSHDAPFPTTLFIGAAKDIADIEAKNNMVMFRYTTFIGKRAFVCASPEEAKEAATRLHNDVCVLRDGEDDVVAEVTSSWVTEYTDDKHTSVIMKRS